MAGRSIEAGIPDAVRIAANHVGVSARRRVTAEAFGRALAGDSAPRAAQEAVATFLNEADPAEIADTVACGATDFPTLARIARHVLPLGHPNRTHLDQLAP